MEEKDQKDKSNDCKKECSGSENKPEEILQEQEHANPDVGQILEENMKLAGYEDEALNRSKAVLSGIINLTQSDQAPEDPIQLVEAMVDKTSHLAQIVAAKTAPSTGRPIKRMTQKSNLINQGDRKKNEKKAAKDRAIWEQARMEELNKVLDENAKNIAPDLPTETVEEILISEEQKSFEETDFSDAAYKMFDDASSISEFLPVHTCARAPVSPTTEGLIEEHITEGMSPNVNVPSEEGSDESIITSVPRNKDDELYQMIDSLLVLNRMMADNLISMNKKLSRDNKALSEELKITREENKLYKEIIVEEVTGLRGRFEIAENEILSLRYAIGDVYHALFPLKGTDYTEPIYVEQPEEGAKEKETAISRDTVLDKIQGKLGIDMSTEYSGLFSILKDKRTTIENIHGICPRLVRDLPGVETCRETYDVLAYLVKNLSAWQLGFETNRTKDKDKHEEKIAERQRVAIKNKEIMANLCPDKCGTNKESVSTSLTQRSMNLMKAQDEAQAKTAAETKSKSQLLREWNKKK